MTRRQGVGPKGNKILGMGYKKFSIIMYSETFNSDI